VTDVEEILVEFSQASKVCAEATAMERHNIGTPPSGSTDRINRFRAGAETTTAPKLFR